VVVVVLVESGEVGLLRGFNRNGSRAAPEEVRLTEPGAFSFCNTDTGLD
jgi:hypothetical protein